MDSERAPESTPRPHRRSRACKGCRRAKVRCSGGEPCQRCARRGDECIFASDKDFVSVSERYLHDLQQRLFEKEHGPSAERSSEPTQARATSPQRQVEIPQSPCVEAQITVANSASPIVSETNNSTRTLPPTTTRIHSSPLLPSAQASITYNKTQSEQQPITLRNVAQPVTSSITRVTSSIAPTAPSRSADDDSLDRDQRQRPRNSLFGSEFGIVHDSQSSLFLFLGPTSTWTFCRRVFTILENAVDSPDTPLVPLNLDGTAFILQWQSKLEVDADDLLRLPPMDHALFLYNTVKFRLGELSCIIDESSFLETFDLFHKNPLATSQEHRLWFIEYLLILALGKALTSGYGSTSRSNKSLNGSYLAARALALLPDMAVLQNKRPALLAMRVLALSALYLHAVDMRSSAYQYIGQAFRLALHDGLHRRMPKAVGPKLISEFSSTWWGIYVLDQEISAGLGCPSTLSQDYITTPTPDLLSSDHLEKALSLRVRLSRLVLTITSCSYSFDQESVSDFVRDTTSNLHRLAELSRDIDQIISFYRTSGGEPPQMFINVNLSYHHCIVLATRPLVIWLLTRNFSPGVEPQWVTGPGATLIEKSGQSAATILSALDDLAQMDIIEAFLPSHLEYAFSAATLLSILSTFLPSHMQQSGWRQSVTVIFEALLCKGSVAVGLRKAELEHLDTLLAPYRTEDSNNDHGYLLGQASSLYPSTPHRSWGGRASAFHDYAEGQEELAQVGNCSDDMGLGTGLWDFSVSQVGLEDILSLAREFENDDPIPWLISPDSS
ncbi:hypothetical protein FSST1_006809 [Fusarium sambucinum]